MHDFPDTGPITAVLGIPAGRVRLIAGDRTCTTVDVRPADPAKSRDVRIAEDTAVAFAGGVLRVEAPTRNQAFGPSGFIDVTVELPAGSRIEVKAASTELRAEGRYDEVAFDGAYGAVAIDEAAAVRVSTEGGDVAVGRLTGPGQITTGKGDILVAEATRGTVALRTRAGTITVAAGVSATLDAGTGYGRVTNSLRNDGEIQLDIHATTDYGDIVARGL
jgi:hypothetical protein